MSIYYRCKDGELLDEICLHYYGQASGAVEQVLAANPGLASLGPILPLGTKLALPELDISDDAQVNLWE